MSKQGVIIVPLKNLSIEKLTGIEVEGGTYRYEDAGEPAELIKERSSRTQAHHILNLNFGRLL
jgi:hypothetical protein